MAPRLPAERMPGESERDWMRRNYEMKGLDPDLAGPATSGPRFAFETEAAYTERLANSRGSCTCPVCRPR